MPHDSVAEPQAVVSREIRPCADQPGNLLEQFVTIATFFGIRDHHDSSETAWENARQVVLPHARVEGGRNDG